MDLKEFIKETIAGIIEATNELQDDWKENGVVVNPPEPGGYVSQRPTQQIDFDVAVTAANDTEGGGKGALKVFSSELSASGKRAAHHEEVSRVKFSIPVQLRCDVPSAAEQMKNAMG